MFNTIGTIIRIILIFSVVIFLWFCISSIFYFTFTFIAEIEFSLLGAFYTFSITMLFRMFYPKNVFV